MKILLLQLKRIGDLILTLPAIAALRQKFPRAQLTLIVSAGTCELLPAIPGLDRSLVVSGGPNDAKIFLTVARGGFDYCLDFTRNDRSAFLALLSRARQRAAPDYPRRRGVLQRLSYNALLPLDVGRVHTVDYHLGLLAPLGIHDAARTVRLDLPAAAMEHAARLLREAGVPERFVLLHPGTTRTEKFWQAERWAGLVEWAAERDLPCVVSGTRSALEQTHLAAIRKCARHPFVDLSGRLDLLTLAALIQSARLLVTVDSAPMHLAGAMDTPQVALFGPTNPFHWRPLGGDALILQDDKAVAASEFSPETPPSPMSAISTPSVIDAMETLLARPRGASV